MSDINVRLKGLEELRAKGHSIEALMEPEMGHVFDVVHSRVRMEGRRMRLGAQRNSITRHGSGLQMTLTTSLNWPRTTGTSWTRKNAGVPPYSRGIIASVVRNAMKKAVERIQAKWAG